MMVDEFAVDVLGGHRWRTLPTLAAFKDSTIGRTAGACAIAGRNAEFRLSLKSRLPTAKKDCRDLGSKPSTPS
jgi:hypothetical protein